MAVNPFKRKIIDDFDPEKYLEKFESFKTAAARRAKATELLKTLNQYRNDELSERTVRAFALAEKLTACFIGRRCTSGACAVCIRRWRRTYSSTLCQYIDSDKDIPWTFLTIVPPDERFSVGDLHHFDPRKLNERLRKQFERNFSEAVVVGGWDFSLQFDYLSDPRPFWRPHWHLVTNAPRFLVRDMLAEYYCANEFTRRPVKALPLKRDRSDLLKVSTYTAKALIDKSNRGMKRTWVNYFKKHDLTSHQAIDIYCLLDRLNFAGRLFRRNAPEGLDFR